MENFYKFLPVFLWLLYRSYKANKKTQQFPKSSSNQDKRKKSPPKLPSFDEILREMMEGKTEETNSKEIDEEVEVESPNQAFEVPEAEYLEEQDAISEIQGVEIDDNQPDSPFDLKSAVIADTILNRPKY